MRKAMWCVIAAGWAGAAWPALAQTTASTATADAKAASKAKILSIEAEVAPQWVTANPFDYREVTDATTASLTLTAKPKLIKGLDTKFTLGPTAKLDSDKDDPDGASSGFGLGAELGIPASKGFTVFASAGFKAAFKAFFEEDAGNERTFSTGLKYGYDIKRVSGMKIVASAAYSLSDASDNLKDQTSAQVKAGFSTPLWWWAAFDIEGSATRRWFENINPDAGYKERRDEWAASIGLNFAKGIVRLTRGDADNPWLRKFKLGFNYYERNSNIDTKDKTSASPSFSIAVGRDF